MKYQKSVVWGALNDSVYCYHFAWGRDAESFVISTGKDICNGFDSSRDVCFGRGHVEIYYRVIVDTIQIYSNVIPKYPERFKYHLMVKQVTHDDYPKLDQQVREGKLQEVSFNRLVDDVPCKPVSTRSNYSIQFK